eukprot:scaffold8630_cov115-Isochrysis_galbana.AAC.2
MARGGARGGRGRVSCCTGADPDRMYIAAQQLSALCCAVALSRSGAPGRSVVWKSGRDAGDYCRGSLLLPMWGDVSVHLLGRSFSRLMHCAKAVAVLMTYDAYYLRRYLRRLPIPT